ncbi:hypothetical protein SZ25_00272 [Candidatus Arcanobacter lacustris]|uniref:Uncharacterized protein n=1 Tax=Candidatus Arcanibacter lacustris TaxID=1607817 RepID=A0A0F5MPN3_9RICK|nr:hypothetical protein SZ25_00272 [Candidatus Arcanobacter lacustris]
MKTTYNHNLDNYNLGKKRGFADFGDGDLNQENIEREELYYTKKHISSEDKKEGNSPDGYTSVELIDDSGATPISDADRQSSVATVENDSQSSEVDHFIPMPGANLQAHHTEDYGFYDEEEDELIGIFGGLNVENLENLENNRGFAAINMQNATDEDYSARIMGASCIPFAVGHHSI